jgi:hypothetical protein
MSTTTTTMAPKLTHIAVAPHGEVSKHNNTRLLQQRQPGTKALLLLHNQKKSGGGRWKSFSFAKFPWQLGAAKKQKNGEAPPDTNDTDAAADEDASVSFSSTNDPLLRETSKILQRASFLSWWAQLIFTTVSSNILLFARGAVSQRSGVTSSWYSPKFFLSGAGLVVSCCRILWTWGNGS